MFNFKHGDEAALRKHLSDHEQKAALSSEIRKSRNEPRISKTRLRVRFESATDCNQNILTHYPLSMQA